MRYKCILVLAGIIVFSPAARVRGQSPADLQQRGIQDLKAGRFAAAERIFSALAGQAPSAANFSYLGVAEGTLGKYRQAIADFQKSIRLGNDSPGIHYNLGRAYLKDRQLESGIRELQAAIGKDPNYTAARWTLAAALLDAGQARAALAELEPVRAQLSKNPGMWVTLVRAEFRAGNIKQALQSINEGRDAMPNDSRLPVALAELCLRHQQPQKARELLESASEAAPHDNKLKLLLARASLGAEEPAEALAVLEGVPSNAGAPGQLDFLRGSGFMLDGKPKEAAPLLAAAAALNPRDVEYLSAYAELEALQRNYDAALATFRKAQQIQPDSPSFPYQMALIYVFKRQYAQAASQCQQATRLALKFAPAYFLLGAIEFDQGKSEAAGEAFRKAVTINPGSALYHAALGAALFKAGRLTPSKQELDRALRLDSHTLAAYFWRAQVLASQQQAAQAIRDLVTFVALDPIYPEAYERLAQLYAAQGQHEKASAAKAQYDALRRKTGPGQLPFFLAQLEIMRFRQVRARPQ